MDDDVVYNHLVGLAHAASPGERLPSVRTLMKQFGRSQLLIERALSRLKSEGAIEAEVGRGTFFLGAARRPRRTEENYAGRSILILRRSVSIGQGRVVLEELRDRLTSDGHRLLEVSYTNADHARDVLRTMPRFDTCIIQTSFEPVSIDTLAAVKQKAGSIVFHGLGIAGSEVDCVGHEWGSSVAQALRLLHDDGHRAIAFATTTYPNIANAMGKRRFLEYCESTGQDGSALMIELPQLPHENYEEKLAAELAGRRQRDEFPFTALIAWGIESGSRFRKRLHDFELELPTDLSLVLLGRPDMRNEHDDFFTIIGAPTSAQAGGLYDLMKWRWSNPDAPSAIVFLESQKRIGISSVKRA